MPTDRFVTGSFGSCQSARAWVNTPQSWAVVLTCQPPMRVIQKRSLTDATKFTADPVFWKQPTST